KRMQADVQRNVNQQERIEQGVRSGELTKKELGNLERGQAHVDSKEARAAANGHISSTEQQGIQNAENHQSKKIHRDKHNQRKDWKGGGGPGTARAVSGRSSMRGYAGQPCNAASPISLKRATIEQN